MSNKERTSITVDPDVAEYLSQESINASGLVNGLVKQFQKSNDRHVAGLELQLERLEEAAEEYREKARKKERQAEDVRELLRDAKARDTAGIDEARDALEGTPREPGNPAIKRWAQRLDMTPTQLTEELE